MQCLLIDDDLDDHEIFTMCLNSVNEHINCTAISDPVEAVSMLTSDKEYTPDYIFIDVNMPKLNGLECLRLLKSINRLADTKMFMYSTSSQSGIYEESKILGATDYIIKPTKMIELKEKLSKVFYTVPETYK